MSIFSVVFKLLGFARKNLGKWLPMIFAAEQKFKSASGPEKAKMILELVRKEETKYLAKLDQKIDQAAEEGISRNNDKINALAAKAEAMVTAAVNYYNELDALLPHSK